MLPSNSISTARKRKVRIGYVVIIVFAVLPIISVLLASLLGWVLNCPVNEAGARDCIRWGINIGEALSTMFIMGWALLYTVPIGLLLIILWTIYVNKKFRK